MSASREILPRRLTMRNRFTSLRIHRGLTPPVGQRMMSRPMYSHSEHQLRCNPGLVNRGSCSLTLLILTSPGPPRQEVEGIGGTRPQKVPPPAGEYASEPVIYPAGRSRWSR
jgi:hypothetical protein